MIYTVQGFFKHLLTEADKIVLTTMAVSYDQGVYAMGASYGSIAARILLQPLEENGRLLWSRLAATNEYIQLQKSYTTLVKLVVYIGLVFSCAAVHYTNLLLNLLAGRKWGANAEAANVLAAFCVYTAFLALNGMTEALVYAVGGGGGGGTNNNNTHNISAKAEMTKLSVVHTVTGIVFAVCATILVSRYGTIGLVAANCIAMSIRSLYSLSFAARYFSVVGTSTTEASSQKRQQEQSLTLSQLLWIVVPRPIILISFIATWVSTHWSLQVLKEQDYHLRLDMRNKEWLVLTCQHVAIGVSCLIGVVFLIVVLERPFLRSLSDMVGRRRGRQPEGLKQD
jgi:oligosaccharide translocation protein RFT1